MKNISTVEILIFSILFAVFAFIFLLADLQKKKTKDRSKYWNPVRGSVTKTMSYDGSWDQDLRVEFFYDGVLYESWASNAFSIQTNEVNIGDNVIIRFDPGDPRRTVVVEIL